MFPAGNLQSVRPSEPKTNQELYKDQSREIIRRAQQELEDWTQQQRAQIDALKYEIAKQQMGVSYREPEPGGMAGPPPVQGDLAVYGMERGGMIPRYQTGGSAETMIGNIRQVPGFLGRTNYEVWNGRQWVGFGGDQRRAAEFALRLIPVSSSTPGPNNALFAPDRFDSFDGFLPSITPPSRAVTAPNRDTPVTGGTGRVVNPPVSPPSSPIEAPQPQIPGAPVTATNRVPRAPVVTSVAPAVGAYPSVGAMAPAVAAPPPDPEFSFASAYGDPEALFGPNWRNAHPDALPMRWSGVGETPYEIMYQGQWTPVTQEEADRAGSMGEVFLIPDHREHLPIGHFAGEGIDVDWNTEKREAPNVDWNTESRQIPGSVEPTPAPQQVPAPPGRAKTAKGNDIVNPGVSEAWNDYYAENPLFASAMGFAHGGEMPNAIVGEGQDGRGGYRKEVTIHPAAVALGLVREVNRPIGARLPGGTMIIPVPPQLNRMVSQLPDQPGSPARQVGRERFAVAGRTVRTRPGGR